VGLRRLALLPFNASAAAKYEWLGRDCEIREQPQTADHLRLLQAMASEHGLEAEIG
jgi:hypothetical protein